MMGSGGKWSGGAKRFASVAGPPAISRNLEPYPTGGSIMLDNVIEAPERLVWAVDAGESGYVILARGDDSEYGRVGIDFTILSDMGYVLGSSLPDVTDKQKAGGPLQVPFLGDEKNSLMLDALEAFCSFLGAAGEQYTHYDMTNRSVVEGDPALFNLAVREWAYQNELEISLVGTELEG